MTLHATGCPKAHTKNPVTTATTASITTQALHDRAEHGPDQRRPAKAPRDVTGAGVNPSPRWSIRRWRWSAHTNSHKARGQAADRAAAPDCPTSPESSSAQVPTPTSPGRPPGRTPVGLHGVVRMAQAGQVGRAPSGRPCRSRSPNGRSRGRRPTSQPGTTQVGSRSSMALRTWAGIPRPTCVTDKDVHAVADDDLDKGLGKQGPAPWTRAPARRRGSRTPRRPRRSRAAARGASTRRCMTATGATGPRPASPFRRPVRVTRSTSSVGGVGGGRLVVPRLAGLVEELVGAPLEGREQPGAVVGGELELAPECPVGITPVPEEPALADGLVAGRSRPGPNRPRRATRRQWSLRALSCPWRRPGSARPRPRAQRGGGRDLADLRPRQLAVAEHLGRLGERPEPLGGLERGDGVAEAGARSPWPPTTPRSGGPRSSRHRTAPPGRQQHLAGRRPAG